MAAKAGGEGRHAARQKGVYHLKKGSGGKKKAVPTGRNWNTWELALYMAGEGTNFVWRGEAGGK